MFGVVMATRVLAIAEIHLRTARTRFIDLYTQGNLAQPLRTG